LKDKIIYIAAFLLAFILVTGGIMYMNSAYKNIFAFDFSPVDSQPEKKPGKQKEEVKNTGSGTDLLKEKEYARLVDSLRAVAAVKDTVVKTVTDTTLVDTIKNLQLKIKELSLKKDSKKEVKPDTVKPKINDITNVIQPHGSTYKSWVKKTVSLYEAMDSRKAAQIILTYSDNVAKDIIYSMKKKKAAEILAQYNPETVNRITRVK